MLQPYTYIFWTPTDFSNIKISSPYPKLSLGNFEFLAGRRLAQAQAFFWPRLPKNTLFGAKKMCFLAEHPIFGDIIQKKFTILPEHQKDKIFVLTRDRLGYGDGILMLEKSVGVQKMNVYGCTVYKKMRFFGPKMGLKPA